MSNVARITNAALVYNLLFYMLFIGIVSNRISIYVSYTILLTFMLVLFLFKIQKMQINKVLLFYAFIMFFTLLLSLFYKYFEYSYVNLYFIQFFGSQVVFFILFSFFVNIKNFMNYHIESFFYYGTVIIFIFTAIDYIILNFGFPLSMQLMYREGIHSYYNMPFGLFGQGSINSTYLVVFYLMYLSFKQKQNILLFFLVTLGVVLQHSGTGFVIYFLMISMSLYKIKLYRYFLLLPISILFLYLILSNLIYKVSIDYIIYLYYFFENILKTYSTLYINNIFDLLFGVDGNIDIPIDFGPLFLIAKVGFIYFILYTIAILYLVIKEKDIYFRLGIISLLLANLHYPALFYPVMNIVLPIVFVYVVDKNKRKKYY